MLANRVREFTTTTGAGDITLAGALPGHIPFAEGFPIGASVTYVIEDGDDYEIGTGTLTDATTLERTTVAETLVAGVYDKASPTAISLSGNAKVFCAATAEMLLDPNVDADIIREVTPDAGVTVDGVVLKDGSVAATDAQFDGSVGIGGAPAYPLHVFRDSEASNIIAERTGAGASRAIMQGGNDSVFFGSLSSDTAHFGTGGLAAITVDVARNVGIGTTSINNMLAVAGDVFINPSVASQNALTVRSPASHTGNLQQWQNSGGVNLVAIGSDGNFVGQNVRGVSAQFYHSGNLDEAIVVGDLAAIGSDTGVYFRTTGFGVSKIADGGTFQWLETVGGQRMALSDTQLTVDVAAQINGNLTATGVLNAQQIRNDWQINVQGCSLEAPSSATQTLRFDSDVFRFWHPGTPDILRLDGTTGLSSFAGSVAIGSTSALEKLHVQVPSGSARARMDSDDVAGIAGVVFRNQTQRYDIQLQGTDDQQLLLNDNTAGQFMYALKGGAAGYHRWYINGALHWEIDQFGQLVAHSGSRVIQGADATSSINISGGDATNNGGNVTFYGSAHTTQAGDITFRTDGTSILQWDDSAAAWFMFSNPLREVGNISVSGSQIYRSTNSSFMLYAGGDAGNDGGNMLLYGSAHTTQANDIAFRTGNDYRLQWDDSINEWNFHGHSAFGIPVLHQSGTASTTQIAGGSGGASGGNVVFYGPTHATNGNDILFRTDATARLQWDHSLIRWDFHNYDVYNVRDLILAGDEIHRTISNNSLTVSGGSDGSLGGAIVLYGENHSTNAGDVVFSSSNTPRLRWDHSALAWDYGTNIITGVSDLNRGAASGQMHVAGGSTLNSGGNIVLYGESHSSNANDISLRAGVNSKLSWDNSADYWNFQNNNLVQVGDISMFGNDIHRNASTDLMRVSGGSAFNLGAAHYLFGEGHSTQALDWEFRTNGGPRLRWDHSAAYWEFENNFGSVFSNAAVHDTFASPGSSNHVLSLQASTGGTSVAVAELVGYRNGSDQGRLAQITFHNHNSTDTTNLRRSASIEAWSSGGSVNEGRLHFYLHDDGSNFARQWTMQGSALIGVYGDRIHRNAADGNLFVSGGSALNAGGNIVLYGQSHSTNAKDILFRSGSTEVGAWDDSNSRWNWRATRFENISDLTIQEAGSIARLAIRRTNAAGAGLGIGTIDWLNDNGSNRGRIAAEFDTDVNSSRLKFEPTDSTATAVTALTISSTAIIADVDFVAEADATFEGSFSAVNLPEYADDSAAGSGGLAAGEIYRTATGEVRCKL